MNDVVAIHGRHNFPTLEFKLKDLVTMVRKKLETDDDCVQVKDIRLNGGAASHVLGKYKKYIVNSQFTFNFLSKSLEIKRVFVYQ